MKTVGKILATARDSKKLTLDDIHKFIKIHPKYLSALETDDYSIFEGKVHAKGFLKIYAEFLGLNSYEILGLWRREYEVGFEKSESERFFKIKSIEVPKFALTPELVVISVVALFISLFFGYLFFQYRTFTGVPNLEIVSPSDSSVVDVGVVDIRGKTDSDSELFINNQQVILNSDGGFTVSVKLKEGVNNFNIVSRNKLDKKSEVIRTVIFRPKTLPASLEGSESTQTTLSL